MRFPPCTALMNPIYRSRRKNCRVDSLETNCSLSAIIATPNTCASMTRGMTWAGGRQEVAGGERRVGGYVVGYRSGEGRLGLQWGWVSRRTAASSPFIFGKTRLNPMLATRFLQIFHKRARCTGALNGSGPCHRCGYGLVHGGVCTWSTAEQH